MAQFDEDLNVDTIEPGSGFDPFPPGDYLVQVTESDIVDSQKTEGAKLLKLTFEVLDGPYAGRKIFENLNYRHPNQQAQQIAQQLIKSICDAIGLAGTLRDTEDLHFRPMVAKVYISTDKTGQYEPSNKIRRAMPAGSTPPAGKSAPQPQQSRPAQTAQQPRQAGAGGRPWGQR